MREDQRMMVAFAGALIGAGIGWRFGRQWIQNMWLRVALFALVAGALAFTFGRSANLMMRAGKLLARMLGG